MAAPPPFARAVSLGMGGSNLMLAGLLALRWGYSGHFPLSNLYESLLFLSWSITALHLVTEKSSRSSLLGVVTAPLSLFTLSFALFSLPKEMQEGTPLVPALRSNWLMMHVTAMVVSYSALLLGSLAALLLLAVTRGVKKSSPTALPARGTAASNSDPHQGGLSFLPPKGGDGTPLFPLLPGGVPPQAVRASHSGLSGREGKGESSPTPLAGGFATLPSALDSLSYRLITLGFPLLTVGILSGAVWANEAWGSYWSWDPKETWALVTWLIFAIYLHARITKGWVGEGPAIIATVGFVTVWVCYLGVNLLGSGLHSYGWF